MVLLGIMMVIGSRQPEFRGIYFPIMLLRQYKIALLVMEGGVLVLPRTSGPVPVKSKRALLSFLSMVNLSSIAVPSSMNYRLVRVSLYFK